MLEINSSVCSDVTAPSLLQINIGGNVVTAPSLLQIKIGGNVVAAPSLLLINICSK